MKIDNVSYKNQLKRKILKLIEAYYEKNNIKMAEEIEEIAKVFEQNGDIQLYEYVVALNPENKHTWKPKIETWVLVANNT